MHIHPYRDRKKSEGGESGRSESGIDVLLRRKSNN